ncbi:hypothetical protein Dimus_020222 [Dionaea muscipula]
MDSLLMEGYLPESLNLFKFNPESLPSLLRVSDNKVGHHDGSYDLVEPRVASEYPNQGATYLVPLAELSPSGDSLETPDFSDACLKYMSEILMEENLEDLPSTLEACCALRAREKELYDALGVTCPTSSDPLPNSFSSPSFESPDAGFDDSPTSRGSNGYVNGQNFVEPNWVLKPFTMADYTFYPLESNSQSSPSSNSNDGSANGPLDSPSSSLLLQTEATNLDWIWKAMISSNTSCQCKPGSEGCQECKGSVPLHGAQNGDSRGKRNHQRDDSEDEEVRGNKHVEAGDDEEEEIQMEQYDDVLLCKEGVDIASSCLKGSSLENEANGKPQQNGNSKGTNGRANRAKKQGKSNNKTEELVDLTALLTHCAQAVASFDMRSAKDLLKQIRQHSSPSGDSIQRLAHYFANALESRIDGNGAGLSSNHRRVPASDVLKAYQAFASTIPFKRTTFFLANLTISKIAETAKKIHIIDFGIFYGFQWPCLIQKLSRRPGGPPELRITGVDHPEPGFRPARVVDETGRRLEGYCKRFHVPFRYQGIAQKWETLQPEDLRIEDDEVVVVNCLFGPKRLLDETVEVNSPRDAFFRLVRRLNPQLFIEGIVNGAFNAPFFITRFREALFYYSSIFDLFEANLPRDSHERMLMERELYGRAVLNVIACEGTERVERPENYKQWHVRTLRGGFRQVPLDQELMDKAKETVKANYHKDFVLGEDNHWMIQGWKGRILFALSCWKPA